MKKSIYATMPEQKEYEILQPGNYVARCYSMIELGSQDKEFSGKIKRQKKVRITWELPTELREDGQPFVIGKDYTLSMHEMGALRPMLESWRGRAFTEEEAQKFDITTILEVPCLINVIHAKSKDGAKTYAEIASISPLPKGMECLAQINETVIFTVDDFNVAEEMAKLPEFIQAKIKESLEYRGEIAPVEDGVDPWAGTAVEQLGFNK